MVSEALATPDEYDKRVPMRTKAPTFLKADPRTISLSCPWWFQKDKDVNSPWQSSQPVPGNSVVSKAPGPPPPKRDRS